MTKRHSTKRSLVASILILCLCFTSFVGTTFAWFTDSVTSANNIIKSGNLDVELYYQVEGQSGWTKVDKDTNVFKEGALWEPGYTEVVKFKVVNEGSLALKYNLGVNVAGEIGSTNVYDKEFKLSDYIEFGVVDGDRDYDRASAVAAVSGVSTKLKTAYSKSSALESKAEEIVTMVVYMPTTVGNEANAKNGAAVPTINLGINLFATQYTYEEDSFGTDYDKGAPWTGSISLDWYIDDPDATEFVIESPEELAGFAAIVNGTAEVPVTTYSTTATPTVIHDDFSGKVVKLAADVNLMGLDWTPIGRIGVSSTDFTYSFKGVFDGQNHTVSNLDVNAHGWAGVFGLAHSAEINNLNVDGVSIVANRLAGAVVGQLYGSIDNCHVKNAEIMVTPNAVEGGYDNGDKVGGIVGWLGDNNNNRTLTNCSANSVKLGAYRDVGGIAGYVAYSTTISGNSVDNLEITVDQTSHYYGDLDPNAGAIWGRNSVSGTGVGVYDSNNTTGAEVYVVSTYDRGGITYKEDGVTDDVILYLVPADYAGSTVNVPEGVTSIGNYAFAYNSNVKTVELPSTVSDLGRGFDSSTVEKVVLNKGLTTISSRAFRRTYNLEEVVISSTVTTIEDNAFQSSAIKNIVFPANVSYIGDSCFTASTVETVLIEGANVEIARFAFRDCPKLTKVTILSDSVTLGEGMIFTNSQNNNQNPNNITIYVSNEAVKDAIVANGTFKGVIVVMKEVADGEEISGSLTDGADTVYLPAGNYTFPADKIGEGDTIICADGTVFEGTSAMNINGATVIGATFTNDSGYAGTGTINGTFKDCVFESSEALRWCYSNAGETVVFENCVFKTDFRGIHFDDMKGDVIFRNCEINGFNAYGGEGTMTFEGCTFGYDKSNYNGLNIYSNTVIKDSTFNFKSGKTDFIDMEGIGKTLTITNCVAYQDGTEINILSKVGGSKLAQNTVILDRAQVVSTSDALKAAIEAKASKVLLADGDYSLSFANNTAFNADGMTIIGIGDNVKLSITSYEVWYGRVQGNNVTFENIHFTSSVGATGKATYNECTFDSWAICASSNNAETYYNNCTINGCLNTSTDFSSGNIFLKGCDVVKAEYSGATTMNFEDCKIGELISWDMTTVLTGCTVTTLVTEHMSSNTITVVGTVVAQ